MPQFNPDDFFSTTTIEDIQDKLTHLKDIDFKTTSLNQELTKINYEIVSSEYEDFMYEELSQYYSFEVDTIV